MSKTNILPSVLFLAVLGTAVAARNLTGFPTRLSSSARLDPVSSSSVGTTMARSRDSLSEYFRSMAQPPPSYLERLFAVLDTAALQQNSAPKQSGSAPKIVARATSTRPPSEPPLGVGPPLLR